MFCPQCGHQNPDAARFCMQCGYNYAGGGSNPSLAPQQQAPQVIVKRGSGLAVVLLLVVLVGGGLGVLLLLNSGVLMRQKDWLGQEKPIVDVKASDDGISGKINLPEVQKRRAPVRQPNPPPPLQPPPPPTYDYGRAQPAGDLPLVNETFSVPAGAVKWWRFTVPEGMTCMVGGDFRARGGGGNDIEVVITDENGANGHAGRFWYQSGKTTVGNIDVHLGPGTYYIVFSNRFSLVSQKTVSARINNMLQ